jgi:hypothetical protein
MRRRLITLIAFGMLLTADVTAQITLLPTDAIAFDYPDAHFQDYQVTRFEVQWDNASAPWTAIVSQPFTDAQTASGSTSYLVNTPFTSGNHTLSVRACNVTGCGPGNVPFAFGYAVNSAPTALPSNFRKVLR